MRSIIVVTALLFLAPLALAQQGRQPRPSGPGTGNPDEHRVPWKFVQDDIVASDRPITLYWMPASAAEAERSPLRKSKSLVEASTRCVEFRIVLPERKALIEKFGSSLVVIAGRDGSVLRRAANVQEVEPMLAAELSAHDEAMYRNMTEANRAKAAGDNAKAIESYRAIWDDRCLFPLAGRDAQRALRDLGVVVTEPVAKPTVDAKVQGE